MSTPEQDRDLALIEAALAEGRASADDPRERQLEEIALALRDDSPRPDPAFARALDKRVEEGFARQRRFRLPALPQGRMLAAAGAAAVLIAVVGAIGVLRDDSGTGGDGQLATRDAQPAAPAPETGLAAPPADATRSAPGAATGAEPERRVERSARMTLAAPDDELQQVADGIGRVAEHHRGYVVNSNFSMGDDSTRGGDFTLRVPTSRLETAMGELSKLGDVRARSESSQDMTAPYRNTENRLGNLLLERRATRDKLRSATGDEAVRLRSRLRALNAEIDDIGERMRDLRQRTVYSTVSVTLEQERSSGAGGGSKDGPGGALDDAMATLGEMLEVLIRVFGVALPLGLVGVVAWLGARVLRRRRREAALF